MRTRFTKEIQNQERTVWTANLRPIVPERDSAILAEAFADAYLDTPDYRDCTPRQVRADAEVEVEMTLAGQMGRWQPEASLVYEDGGHILGAILVVTWHEGPWLRWLFVRRGWRRAGAATALLRASTATLGHQGNTRLSTFASDQNLAAVAFLKAHGFAPHQEIGKTGNRQDRKPRQ